MRGVKCERSKVWGGVSCGRGGIPQISQGNTTFTGQEKKNFLLAKVKKSQSDDYIGREIVTSLIETAYSNNEFRHPPPQAVLYVSPIFPILKVLTKICIQL